MPTSRSLYISAGASRSSVSDARSQDGLVAFGSARLLALWNSADKYSAGIHQLLPGHEGDITALKFLPTAGTGEASRWLVTGDSVGTVRVWHQGQDDQWTTTAELSAHQQSVSALALLPLPPRQRQGNQLPFLLVTGSSDASLQVWTVGGDGKAELTQKLDTKGKYPLALDMTYLPASTSIALVMGSTEARITVFSSPTASQIKFSKSLALDGHSDWVRSLAFTTPFPLEDSPTASTSTSSIGEYDIAPGEVLLASGSQDNYIRLWRFSRVSRAAPEASSSGSDGGLSALDELERQLSAPLAAEQGTTGELRVKAHDFAVPSDGTFSCASEAVLLGHDAWVTGLNWSPARSKSARLQLLSASADRSMILWAPEETTAIAGGSSTTSGSVWTTQQRFGEFASQTNLGFFGALWGLNASTVLASGWGGSWHVWKREDQGDAAAPTGGEKWEPQVATSGHMGQVRSVRWEPEGEYLLSTGFDMATRLHAPWRRQVNGKEIVTWHELGRPQIHGYQIASIAFTSRLQFVSGADEKIVRVFDAPKVFVSSLRTLSGVDLGDEESRPMAANVPPLGLSNRAIADTAEADAIADSNKDEYNTPLPFDFTLESHPPFEEQLLGSTLWPETEKLYGHGFEIIAVAAAHTLPLIATACKATSAEHAIVRLYDSRTWKPTGKTLQGHALTITSMSFSHDDRYLLTVSRDRTWHLYERDGNNYTPAATLKSHARIIWDACWAFDDTFFATASRDKSVKIWIRPETQKEPTWDCATTLKLNDAATAVALTVLPGSSTHLLAIGLESGRIHLFTASNADLSTWTPFLVLDHGDAHVMAVTTLDFSSKVVNGRLRLASGSEDRAVRVIEIEV